MRLAAWIYWNWTKLHRWIENCEEMRSWINFLVRSFSFCLYNVFCVYALDSPLLYQSEKIWKIVVWLTGPTRESHETKKLQTSIPLFSYTCTCMTFEKKTKSLSLYSFLFFPFFWQILTNAKHTPTNVTSMLRVTTRTDRTFAHANLDILEMDTTVQVQSIISEAFIFILTIIRNFCLILLFLFVCLFCFDIVES